ncbi:aldose epimerase family protein [Chelativorans sp. M5D2P16]|uniref:aldose epimerase family protein n=1 Tax=Chelativorans sp. M5D2P16 TaxID=3095678 RepID=UPI002ACACE14|nr:aldose epimerase family protein [Chelativorans sp. M5D2P16]MDZ5700029.1 aldose epimerase family protein [Chelativorans sp. M5D2P16]
MAGAPRKIGTHEGRDVFEAVLTSETGVEIAVMSYGAAIRDWRVPVAGGKRTVVLGFDRFEDYPAHSPYFGAVAGRVANRIGGSRFTLDGREYRLPANEGENHLHGGPRGIGRQVWDMEPLSGAEGVRLRLVSPDGEMGYPGRLAITVTYQLEGNRLRLDFGADTDRPTPVNIVQHNYFNLMGEGDVRDHMLEVAADAYTVTGEDLIPTGEIRSVSGTHLDFRKPRRLCDAAGGPLACDDNLVLDGERDLSAPAATVTAPDESLTLRLWTDQPGIQLYTGGMMHVPVPGLDGRHYPRFGGLCLEDQNFPDAINHPHFPSPVITPERPYRHWCEIEIG